MQGMVDGKWKMENGREQREKRVQVQVQEQVGQGEGVLEWRSNGMERFEPLGSSAFG